MRSATRYGCVLRENEAVTGRNRLPPLPRLPRAVRGWLSFLNKVPGFQKDHGRVQV